MRLEGKGEGTREGGTRGGTGLHWPAGRIPDVINFIFFFSQSFLEKKITRHGSPSLNLASLSENVQSKDKSNG